MFKHCIPHRRRGVYALVTIPVIVAYGLIGWYLLTLSPLFLAIYCALFVVTIALQSYNCVFWKCPHIGTVCPGAGGFCILSSPLAYSLIKLGIKGSKGLYTVLCSIASLTAFCIVVYPIYFLYNAGILYLALYIVVWLVHGAGLLLKTCQHCGAKQACPGGQFSSKLLSKPPSE